jgi:hypothetical protein
LLPARSKNQKNARPVRIAALEVVSAIELNDLKKARFSAWPVS